MKKKFVIAIYVNFLLPIAGLSTDIYLPSLPSMSSYFLVSKGLVQLTVAVFAFALGVGQIIAGPVSDALGRKKLFVVALALQVLSIVIILVSPVIQLLIVGRFLQGIAVAFVSVPARAVLQDVFEGDELKKQFNYATISFAVWPIIAPVIGSYLQHYWGWRACFWFLFVYILIALAGTLIYRETSTSMTKFSVSLLWHKYLSISKNYLFLVCCLFAACLVAPTMLFNVAGPFLIQLKLHYSSLFFGKMALLIGMAWFLGSVTNRVLFGVSSRIKIYVSLATLFLGSTVLLLLGKFGILNLWSLMLPLFFMVYVCGGVFSLIVAESLSMIRRDLAATANATLFCCIWLGVAFFSWIATSVGGCSLLPMGLILASTVILMLFLYFIKRRLFILHVKH